MPPAAFRYVFVRPPSAPLVFFPHENPGGSFLFLLGTSLQPPLPYPRRAAHRPRCCCLRLCRRLRFPRLGHPRPISGARAATSPRRCDPLLKVLSPPSSSSPSPETTSTRSIPSSPSSHHNDSGRQVIVCQAYPCDRLEELVGALGQSSSYRSVEPSSLFSRKSRGRRFVLAPGHRAPCSTTPASSLPDTSDRTVTLPSVQWHGKGTAVVASCSSLPPLPTQRGSDGRTSIYGTTMTFVMG